MDIHFNKLTEKYKKKQSIFSIIISNTQPPHTDPKKLTTIFLVRLLMKMLSVHTR